MKNTKLTNMPKKDVRFICWIGMPRSGSNYVSDLLANLDNFWSLREIFQANGVHAYNGLRGHFQKISLECQNEPLLSSWLNREGANADDDESWRAPELITFARSHPGMLLDIIAKAAGNNLVSFKVFAGDLNKEQLLDEVLDRSDVVPAILHRDIIEAYVSAIKGKQVGRFTNVDTTNVAVKLNWRLFCRFVHGTARFQSGILNVCNGGIPIIAYEDLMTENDDDARLCRIISDLDSAWDLELGTRLPQREVQPGVARQDQKRDYAATVENWTAFLNKCRKHGLDGRHSRHLRQDSDPELTSAERFVECAKWAERLHLCLG